MTNLFDPEIESTSVNEQILEAKAFFSPVYIFTQSEGKLHLDLARQINSILKKSTESM